MSVRIMSLVWGHAPAEGNALLVLLALADFSDDAGRCWPSMVTIARKARVSERGARGIIRRLEAGGLLVCESSMGRSSNHYRITVNPEAVSGSEATNPEAVSGTNSPNPEDSDTQPGSPLPPNHQEPSIKEGRDSRAFSQFWETYPKRQGKKAAAAKFSAAVKSGIKPERLIDGAARYAAWVDQNHIEERYIKQPATWLNQGCWDDELKQGQPKRKKDNGRDEYLRNVARRLDERTASDSGVDHDSDQGDPGKLLPTRDVG